MEKSTFTPAGAALRQVLAGIRKAAGLTQRELARKLGREHSFVARIEQGERKVDVVEFCWICEACGVSPQKMISPIARAARVSRGSASAPLRPAKVRL